MIPDDSQLKDQYDVIPDDEDDDSQQNDQYDMIPDDDDYERTWRA